MMVSFVQCLGVHWVVVGKDKLNELKEELSQREKLINELNKTWEQRLKEAQALQQERKAALQGIDRFIMNSLTSCC